MNKNYIEWVKSDYNSEQSKNITYIKIEGEHLRVFPSQFLQLSNLLQLHIGFHNLKFLPDEFSNLVNLKKLNINNNKFNNFPISICSLSKLKHLDISENNINTIPPNIKNLTSLKTLILSKNDIDNIPSEIHFLSNLNILFIDQNNISYLPIGLFNLTNLTHLDFCINNIDFIHPNIINLINLEHLSCNYNNISKIPIQLFYMINLDEHLSSFNNNPISILQPQIINRFIKKNKPIFFDPHNVNNKFIQNGIIDSIHYLIHLPISITLTQLTDLIQYNNILNLKTKENILKLFDDNYVHIKLHLSFKELFLYVFDFILKHQYCNNILSILDSEFILDQYINEFCHTGHFTNLINVLNGFDNNINIKISENEEISNIIIFVRNNLIKNNNYNIENHKKIVINELLSRNYTMDIINLWVDHI
jgi:Leucine-rich repeat (LRR) protein